MIALLLESIFKKPTKTSLNFNILIMILYLLFFNTENVGKIILFEKVYNMIKQFHISI